jgi:Transposase domain (DUF772)
MARYKPIDRNPRLLPVVLSEQIQPGTFEFALDHLVDHELDLSALDARFRNDETGASAYDPRVMLKIVLLGYSRGLISSRRIEAAQPVHAARAAQGEYAVAAVLPGAQHRETGRVRAEEVALEERAVLVPEWSPRDRSGAH